MDPYEVALTRLEEFREIMLTKHCPINNTFCNKNCVWFDPGRIERTKYDNHIYYNIELPECTYNKER